MSTLSLIDGVIPWCSQSAQEDLRKVRADVAELIEAADEASVALGKSMQHTDELCSHMRLCAALARVHPMTREQQAAETEKRA